eukprot:1698112-Lingulodinium_polyedra.AAC.1
MHWCCGWLAPATETGTDAPPHANVAGKPVALDTTPRKRLRQILSARPHRRTTPHNSLFARRSR